MGDVCAASDVASGRDKYIMAETFDLSALDCGS